MSEISEIKLFNTSIIISQARQNYIDIRDHCEVCSVGVADEFIELAEEHTSSLYSLIEKADAIAATAISDAADEIVAYYLNNGIYSITKDNVIGTILDNKGYCKEYDKLVNAYSNIVEEASDAREMRAQRAANRGRWSGGGFGLEGAVKGAATAGALNAVSGIGHGFVNMIGNAVSDAKRDRELRDYYNDPKTFENIARALQNAVSNYFITMGEVLSKQASMSIEWITTSQSAEASNIFKNVDNQALNDGARKDMLIKILNLDPYYAAPYKYIFEHYGVEEKAAIIEMADLFGVDLDDCITIYASGKDPSEITTLDEAAEQKQQIAQKLAELGIEEHDLLNLMDERIVELKIESYKKQINDAEDTQALIDIRNRFNAETDLEEDDKTALSEEVDKADLALRTFMDIEFSTQNEAVKQKQIYDAVKKAISDAKSVAELKELAKNTENAEHEKTIKAALLEDIDDAIVSLELKEIETLSTDRVSTKDEIDVFLGEIRNKGYSERAVKQAEHDFGLLKNFAVFSDKVDSYNEYFKQNDLIENAFDNKVVLTYTQAYIGTLAPQAKMVVGALEDRFHNTIIRDVVEPAGKIIKERMDLTPKDLTSFGGSCEFMYYGDSDFDSKVQKLDGYRDDKFDIPVFAVKCSEADIIIGSLFLTVEGRRFDLTKDIDIQIPKGLLAGVKITQGEKEYEIDVVKIKKNMLHLLLLTVGIVKDLISGIATVDEKGGAFDIYCDIAEKFGRFIDTPEMIADVMYFYKSNADYSDTDKLVFSVNDEVLCGKIAERISEYDLEKLGELKCRYADMATEHGFAIDALNAVVKKAENIYIAKYMTFNGIAYSSVSEKQEAERRYANAEKLCSECNSEDFASVIAAIKGIYDDSAEKVAADKVVELKNYALDILQKTVDTDTLRKYKDICGQLKQQYDSAEINEISEKAEYSFALADGKDRTYKGILYDTLDIRNHAQRSDEEITEIMRTTDFKNAVVVYSAFNKIHSSGYLDSIVAIYAPQLTDSCRKCLSVTNSIPVLEQLCGILKNSSVDNAYVSAVYAETEAKYLALELASRTYKGVEFESVEQMEAGKLEEQTCEVIMRTASKDSIDSIRNAEKQIGELVTPIKTVYLARLAEMAEQYERNLRTYRGIEYASVDDAKAAEEEYKTARELYRTVDKNDINSVKNIYNQICAGKYGSAKEYIDELNDILVKHDISCRTVAGILFETTDEADKAKAEYEKLEQLMQGLNTDDEQDMLNARQTILSMDTAIKDNYLIRIDDLLTRYDIKCRTFNGKVYDTRDMVNTLTKEQEEIQSIWNSVSQEDEATMLDAKDRFMHMETFLKDAEIVKIDKMLEKYDISVRTVRNVKYATREEAALVRKEYEIIDAAMAAVEEDDEATILDAQQKIGALTTDIKKPYLDKLNKIWSALDLKLRTFEKIVFDTREQAENARTTKEEFLNRFNTLDLLDINNVYQLENYIEDELNEKIRPEATNMVNDVKDIISNVNAIIAQNQTVDPEANKKESTELYKLAEKTVARMKKYNMNTATVDEVMQRHYGSLNVGQKLFSFIKKKF